MQSAGDGCPDGDIEFTCQGNQTALYMANERVQVNKCTVGSHVP
jgi:hypothetical protein